MFKHFVREGHADRSSLRQSTQDGCLQSIKCRCCQSVRMSKIEDGTGHVTRWLLSMWTFYFIYLLLIFTSRCFKQEQTAYMVTDCTLQITIVQIVWIPAWQTQYPTRCWRNHMQHDMSFFLFNKLTRCSPEWRLRVRAGIERFLSNQNEGEK